MGDLFNSIMAPLEYGVSWILITIHSLLANLGVPEDSGLSWGPSIVVLVVIVRILLIPLFVKQIRAQRGLQLLQPKMAELRKKYGSDRQKMSEELMKLYQETGTNPFSSCLPILAQSPFFFGLYRILDGIANNHERGVLTPDLIESGRSALIFGAPLSDSFLNSTTTLTPYVTVVMIVLMCTSQFITQRQIMLKNMPGGGDNPMAQQQKILLYVFPLVFAVSGVYFPVGVLLYWLTTNLWTMGQQFYVIRRMPAPGSKAEEAFNARKAAKAAAKGQAEVAAGGTTTATTVEPVPPRQQPKRQSRTQRKAAPPAKKAQASSKQATSGSAAPSQPPTGKQPAAGKPSAGGKAAPPTSGKPAPRTGSKAGPTGGRAAPPTSGNPSANGQPGGTPKGSPSSSEGRSSGPGSGGSKDPAAGDGST